MDSERCQPAPFLCAVDAPYPDTRGACPNENDAALLSFDYAGCTSEMSAITAYLFREHMMPDACADLARALEHIAIAEMRHLDLLGSTIATLGGCPIYAAGCNRRRMTPWSGTFVNYATGPCTMLRLSLAEEQAAIAQYRAHIPRISQLCVRKLIERIILDEELHARIFCELIERHCMCP